MKKYFIYLQDHKNKSPNFGPPNLRFVIFFLNKNPNLAQKNSFFTCTFKSKGSEYGNTDKPGLHKPGT